MSGETSNIDCKLVEFYLTPDIQQNCKNAKQI